MSRYRKIEVRTWSDEKFRHLSQLPASGQGLWFFLLTGPHTGPIPGLFRAGRAAMAEELGWSQEGFDKAFNEVFVQGMAKADFKSRLVWLPNAIKHNKPESPNVVRNWGKEFDLLPECQLKDEALKEIGAYICGLGEGYRKAFDEAFKEALEKASSKAMPNQEQEQDQDQDKQHTSQTGNQEEYSTEFEELWLARPRREGADSKKSAFKAYKARIRQGVGHQQLMDGIEAYRRYCEAKGLIGTDKVKMTSTFLGPDEHWKQNYTITSHSVGNVRFTENSDPLGLDDTGWAEGMHILGGDR